MLPTTNIHVDVITLGFIAGTVIPLIVALLTKSSASSSVKAVANLVLTAIGAAVALLIANNGTAPWTDVAAAAAAVFLASGSSYSHAWKPLGVSSAIATKTRGFGVG